MKRVEKSNEFSDEISLLTEKASAYGIRLTWSELSLFQVYLEELWEWHKRFNLTGVKTRERMVIELFLDSLIPDAFVPETAILLDVGSGAGFPGLPLKIRHPGLETYLLEPNTKKVAFLRQAIRCLKLQGIDVIQGRIEGYKEWFGKRRYGLITARAVANLTQILVQCSPVLSAGGFLVAFLGAEGEKDVEKNKDTMETHGLSVKEKITYILPGKKTKRHTFILKKTGPAQDPRLDNLSSWPMEKKRA
jgi:16S rRNA (guanine527-N7)-methyltransferase